MYVRGVLTAWYMGLWEHPLGASIAWSEGGWPRTTIVYTTLAVYFCNHVTYNRNIYLDFFRGKRRFRCHNYQPKSPVKTNKKIPKH